MGHRKYTVTLAWVLFWCLVVGGRAVAATYYVCDCPQPPEPPNPSCPGTGGTGTGTQLDPFCTISQGINAAANGDTVLVADGTYTGIANANLGLEGKAITLRSQNGPAACIIDRELVGRAFNITSGEGPNSVVQGFTIRNGNVAGGGAGIRIIDSSPTIIGNVIENCETTGPSNGGGIYCSGVGSPSIVSNVIHHCKATDDGGGGIYTTANTNARISDNYLHENEAEWGAGIYVEFATLIERCTLEANTAENYGGGVAFGGTGSITVMREIRDSFFKANKALGEDGGGAVFNANGPFRITGCLIINNEATNGYGGGITSGGPSATGFASWPRITRCQIIGNKALAGGGGIYLVNTTEGKPATITNTLIARNIAMPHTLQLPVRGGGILGEALGTLTIRNCTIAYNVVQDSLDPAIVDRGGGLALSGSTTTLSNSVLWGNQADEDSGQQGFLSGGALTVRYTDSQDGLTANGFDFTGMVTWDVDSNLNIVPKFVDILKDDFRVQLGSFVNDIGNNLDVVLDSVDLDGDGNTGEAIPDLLGVFRRGDDPLTAATGNPLNNAPYVDMGAYERCGFIDPAIPQSAPVTKNRYLAFSAPGNLGVLTAIRVTLVDLMNPNPPNLLQYPAPNYSAFEGQVRYVGPPTTCEETEAPHTSFTCAKLQCAPHYRDWSLMSLIQVTGTEVVPSSNYRVETLGPSCQGNEAGCAEVSCSFDIQTGRWGDVTAPYQVPLPAGLTQPDILDISAVVDKFKGVHGAPVKAQTKLQPNVPNSNGAVNILDVANTVDAFKYFAYPYAGPVACP